MTEIWKDVKGYEGFYQVSNLGRMKSLARIDGCNRPVKERILKASDNGSGYLFVMFSKKGKHKNVYIHRLMAEAFIPNLENKREVNHKDGNKHNNVLSNLEWMSSSENTIHAYSHGLQLKGEYHGQSKLTWEQVNWIRKHYIKGDKEYGQRPLARKFNVYHATIKNIVYNKTWREK